MKDSYNKIIHQFLINNVNTSYPKELAFQMTVYTIVAQNPHKFVAPDETLDHRKQ